MGQAAPGPLDRSQGRTILPVSILGSIIRGDPRMATVAASPQAKKPVPSDIEIAQQSKMKPISEIARRLGIPDEAISPFGHYKAKISLEYINTLKDKPEGKLILVTA